MITDGEKWHYLTVKNLSRLLRGITSNHHSKHLINILYVLHNTNKN